MIQEFLDGTLSAEEEKAFDRHVAGCAACARQIAAFRAVESHLGRLEKETPPEGFAEPVIRYLKAAGKIRAPLPSRRAERVRERVLWWLPGRLRVPALAAVALVVVLSTVSVMSGSFLGMVGKGTIAAKDVYLDAHQTITDVRVLDDVSKDLEKDVRTAKTVAGAVYLLISVLGQTYMLPALVTILLITVLASWYVKAILRRSDENASYSF
jgi:hypothetical protein